MGILGVSESAKSGELSCREAAALALRDLAATGKVAQDEIFFQLCARAKQIQASYRLGHEVHGNLATCMAASQFPSRTSFRALGFLGFRA